MPEIERVEVDDGPEPSTLTFLSNLPKFHHHHKVRFLGCVTHYDTSRALLTLYHNYPCGTPVTAIVDVALQLEGLRNSQIDVGVWLNIVGRITSETIISERGKKRRVVTNAVKVSALMVWPAGPVELDRYERMVFESSRGLETVSRSY